MITPGEQLFARYAHAPNALGYCGPVVGAALEQVACGAGTTPVDLSQVARRFSGAWPYQALIGELAGLDPLSVEVGRAYWTGSALTDEIDAERLGELLLERFAGQAGHYWSHLTDDLLTEVTPTHAFHVFGVYPWSRLLASGAPEPLHVLDSCRIRAGQVLAVTADDCTVHVDSLDYTDGRLRLQPVGARTIRRRTAHGTFTNDQQLGSLEPGDWVAVHWDFACDRLTAAEAVDLLARTERQLELTNRRLAR